MEVVDIIITSSSFPNFFLIFLILHGLTGKYNILVHDEIKFLEYCFVIRRNLHFGDSVMFELTSLSNLIIKDETNEHV